MRQTFRTFQTLIIMVKEPRVGRVKTRLGRDIGMIDATWWFRHQSRALIRRMRDPRWQIVLSVAPDRQGMSSRFWPKDLPRLPQGRGDIGQRMARAMRSVSGGPVCLVGADIPDLSPRHISRAFGMLGANDLVFGPAKDGGFWLVGVRQGGSVPKGLFQNVGWSKPETLSDTLASVAGLRIGLVDQLRDVDRGTDLAHAPRP